MSRETLLDKKIEKLIYLSTFIATLLFMIPMAAYVARQITTLTEFLTSLTGLTTIACSIHLLSFRKLLKKSNFNADNQQNILFAASVVFLELNNIKYIIHKTENKSNFAFHLNWPLIDPHTEQLRAIFCSLCIHNFKGITPTQSTRLQLQNEWECNLTDDLSDAEKKKLWKDQTKMLKVDFNNNKKLIHKIHKSVLVNNNSEAIESLVKALVIYKKGLANENEGR